MFSFIFSVNTNSQLDNDELFIQNKTGLVPTALRCGTYSHASTEVYGGRWAKYAGRAVSE